MLQGLTTLDANKNGVTELGDTGHAAGGGSNYPYSGWKHWVFEGGVRSAAFVWWAPLNRARGGSSRCRAAATFA